MTSDIQRVRALSQKFFTELTETVQQSLGLPEGLVTLTIRATETRVVISTSMKPVALFVDGDHKLDLAINYALTLSTNDKDLAVADSSFKVFPTGVSARSGPLVTLDYLREPEAKDIPTAHINVHAHNDSLLRGLADSGSSRRAKNRRKKAAHQTTKGKSTRSPHGSEGDIHIPVGGARFRPCLEDLLEMLIVEFGVDCAKGNWRHVLAKGRKRWREHQLRAAIKDNPDLAANHLRDLGYDVVWDNDGEQPQPNLTKLERF